MLFYDVAEGKLEFPKTESTTEEAGSPKSGQSSPEPSDCDNDSNSSSNTSTGFNVPQIPSPPDITPLLAKNTCSVKTGGAVQIPVTQSFVTSSLVTVPQPTTFTAPSHINRSHQSSSSRNNRRTSKQNRPKQPSKQRVIKFHEYKGPPTSKSSNASTSSIGSFVTTTGPMQKLDNMSPYEVRVHQQRLYLQCQIEVENKNGSMPTVLVPIKTAPNPPVLQQQLSAQQMDMEPATPKPAELARSRPVTPSLNIKSPTSLPGSNTHSHLHASRSLSHLEEMKVADLKQELKQRNLTVSGSKPQLIERLRAHQLQELSGRYK